MTRTRPFLLLGLLSILAVAAGAVLVIDAAAQPRHAERAEEFQHLVGGLGLGPALDLSRDPFRFDPRLADESAGEVGPLPGGARYDPDHASSIFHYPPLDRQRSR
jgi:hypothetical protein